MNLNDMGFKTPDPSHPRDLAMESIAAQIPAQPNMTPSLLMKDGKVLHSGGYSECWKLRDLVRQCGGQVSMFSEVSQ